MSAILYESRNKTDSELYCALCDTRSHKYYFIAKPDADKALIKVCIYCLEKLGQEIKEELK